MENILKPKGMLCNINLVSRSTGQQVDICGQLVNRLTYVVNWLTGQHSGRHL